MFMGSDRDWAFMAFAAIVGGITILLVCGGLIGGLLYLLYRGVMAVIA